MHFAQNFKALCASRSPTATARWTPSELRHCMFGDFMGEDEPDARAAMNRTTR